jgi:hypothetical protein
MEILKYGNFEIIPDVQMTKDYYSNLTPTETQVTRNFAEYCQNMPEEEKAFFEKFGIDTSKITIAGTYDKKEKMLFCFGEAYFCGDYLKTDFQDPIFFEQDSEDFDELFDYKATAFKLGNFEFIFEKEGFSANQEAPDGFIAVNFTLTDVPWLLDEKPEKDIIAYEPIKKWEIHKQIWNVIKAKKSAIDYKRKSIKFIEETLIENGLEFRKMGKREYERYRAEWLKRMIPGFADEKKAREHCLGEGCYLWHLFSFSYAHAVEGKAASDEFDSTKKCKSILLCNWDEKGYVLSHTYKLKAEILEKFTDVIVTSANFAWTYCKTHESDCGPYFYRPKKKNNI